MHPSAESLQEQLRAIRLFAFDVDGVLTDGRLTYIDRGAAQPVEEIKSFNVKDGQGIALLIRQGMHTAIITARESAINAHRGQELGVHYICQNQKNKLETLTTIIKELDLELSEVAYMGDDLPDLKVLEAVGLPCCPADAVPEVRNACKFISQFAGGQGAVRELCDLILYAQNKYPVLQTQT